jgi:RND superfamily putative drug exporter
MIVTMRGSPLEPDNLRQLRAFTATLDALPGVEGVRSAVAELDPDALSPEALARAVATEPTATKIRRMVDGNAALVVAENEHPWQSAASGELVEAIRAAPHPGLEVRVGGPTAQMVDLVETLKGYALVAVTLVAGWNFLVLLAAFRSVFVPIKAILMNCLSLGASYGLLVWVFQDGHGAELLDFVPQQGVDPTIPLVMFAVVFGLSMDYEVFLLSRIQEEWRRTRDNRASVIEGLARTGRIITSAALILLVVVGAFVAGDLVYVKQIGLGMAAAIALDVTIVRALLVPATMQLLGDWNWWAPRWMRPRAAPLEARRLAPPGPTPG